MADDKAFLGVGWGFPPAFDTHSRGAVLVAHLEDIRQSLWILLGTTPGERVMQPSYGCNLRRLVFEVMDRNITTDIRDTIERAIRLFEPRIILNAIDIDTSDWIDGTIRIHLDYTVIASNTPQNMVYPLYLLEASGQAYQA